MRECATVRRLLALRPADRSEAERARVDAHLAGCPTCVAVARAYAEQDRRPQAGPRVTLTPTQRRNLFGRLEQLRRGQRVRARLAWALGVPLGIAAVLALVVAVSYLLGSRQTPAGMGGASPTAVSSPSISPLAVSPAATPLPAFPTSWSISPRLPEACCMT
jgi:predicted anti-sigma-YlaC factor YlaD